MLRIDSAGRSRKANRVDQVIDAVAVAMTVDRRAICADHSRGRARSVAMYLSYNLTGLKQREIVEAFGIGRFAVSKAAAKVDAQVLGDARLRRLLTRLRKALSASS